MTLKAKLIALTAIFITLAAHAEIRTFTISGTVTEASPTAPLGAPVTGTFAYDTDAIPYFEFIDPNWPRKDAAYLGVPESFRIQVNGHTLVSEIAAVGIMDYSGDGGGDCLHITGERMTLDGTRFEEGAIGLTLCTTPSNYQVLRSTKLPRKIHVRRFDWMNYGTAQVNGSSTGTILTFHIDRIRAAKPEPDDDD